MAIITPEQHQFIISSYHGGQSIYQIAPQVGCAPQTVHKHLLKAGVVCRNRSGLTDDQKATKLQERKHKQELISQVTDQRQKNRDNRRHFIVSEYCSGRSACSIARELNISVPAVRFYLETSHIERRSLSDACTTRELDEHAFRSIEIEEQAYWLGFLTADCGISDTSDLRLNLQLRDTPHLERLRRFLKLSTPIRLTPICSYLDLRSRRMCQDLAQHGLGPRKSKTVRWPCTLPPELNRHYVRGVFDGDGTFCSMNKKGAIQWRLIGNRLFLIDCQETMMQELGLRRTKLVDHHTTESVAYLCYNGSRQVSQIATWMYDGSSIWLPRKRKRFIDYINFHYPGRITTS